MSCDNPQCPNQITESRSPLTEELPLAISAIRPLHKCSACKDASYCCRECQVAHWPGHKLDCKERRKQRSDIINAIITTRLQELQKPLLGRHAPVDERLTIKLLDDDDDESRMAKAFVDSVDMTLVSEYAMDKFRETRDKGAVVFNIRYPYDQTPERARHTWMPRQLFVQAQHQDMLTQVTRYTHSDPERACVTFFILPSKDRKTAQIWSIEPQFKVGDTEKQQLAIHKIAWERSMKEWQSKGFLEPTP